MKLELYRLEHSYKPRPIHLYNDEKRNKEGSEKKK